MRLIHDLINLINHPKWTDDLWHATNGCYRRLLILLVARRDELVHRRGWVRVQNLLRKWILLNHLQRLCHFCGSRPSSQCLNVANEYGSCIPKSRGFGVRFHWCRFDSCASSKRPNNSDHQSTCSVSGAEFQYKLIQVEICGFEICLQI
jgi:hypothetical protein